MAFCVGTVCALALVPVRASHAQEAPLLATLEANRRAFTLDEDGLGGDGGEWLLDRAREARFTLLGESHHNAETPLLTSALLRQLRPAGYGTYVVESGPETTRLLMEAVRTGGVEAGEALLTPYPFSIAFLDRREELRAAATALALGYDVWGADQEFMGSPRLLFTRLQELAASDAPRELARDMLERERAAFEQFVTTGDPRSAFLMSASAAEFERLAAAFAGDDEAARIVEQLRASADVYQAFAERRYYDNNENRVELIKRNFLAHLGRADASPLSDRRALIKMGSVHAGRGRTPMHVFDIGNLAAELAFAGGGTSLHIVVLATGSVRPDGTFHSWREESPHLAPFFDLAAADAPVVYDLAPLRPLLTQQANKSAELQDLQDLALRYDALVLFPRFHPADPVVPDPQIAGP